MALDKKNLIELAKITASANPSSVKAYSYGEHNFSYKELNDTLRTELNELCGTYSLFRENKNTLFQIMEEVIDDVLPAKVMEQYGQFAETKVFRQGQKPIFTQKITAAARRRAKQFVTKVGLAGIYEVFRLDGNTTEVQTSAFGGAAQIGFEEFLDGNISMADVLDIILEGLDEAIYCEIERALIGAIDNLQTTNKTTQSGFVESEMTKLLQVADAYGESTIYCTAEFAATMVPASGWVSEEMRNSKWNNGYLANFHGHKVVVMRQSFEDETNEKKVIDPSLAWIIPTGADKPVKIAFEGETIVRDIDNKDMSKEIQVYKKFGVAAVITNNICVYKNSSLAV